MHLASCSGSGGFTGSGFVAPTRRWLRGEHGGVAVETALALFVLVVAVAGVMEIVSNAYASDRMGRAARTAARAIALDPGADYCAEIRRELRLDEEFDCEESWTVTVDRGVSAQALPATLTSDVTAGGGDLVLVRIAWSGSPWFSNEDQRTANAEDGDEGEASPSPGLMTRFAVGLARSEPHEN